MYDQERWKVKQELDFYNDRREIEKAKAKAFVKEKVKIDAFKYRQQLKEEEEERKRAIFEELQIMQNGKLQIVTKNLQIDAIPRIVTNMESPRAIILKRMENENDQVVLIKCNVKGNNIEIFMKPDMIGSGTYVLKKFAAKGIDFALPTAKAKRVATCLVVQLSAKPEEILWLPEHAGWVQNVDETFGFFGKGTLTWEKAQKLAK